jgi:calcineurin-like phosphoesterase family protein
MWTFPSEHYKNSRVFTSQIENIYVWSDQHFNHKNIIKYSDRPFGSIQEMNEYMVFQYCSLITPNDVVIWVGDVGFGDITLVQQLLAECVGYNVLIPGNHDFKGLTGKLRDMEFDEIHAIASLPIDGTEYIFTHYPLTDIPDGCVSVHGHTHTINLSQRHINVSVEQLGYCPINLRDLVIRRRLVPA